MTTVYTLHRAVPLPARKQERGTVRLAVFIRQVRWLQRLGVRFISLDDLAARLTGNDPELPRCAAVLTIDDGYVCVFDHIFPFLQKQQIPFTVFAVPGFIGGESHLYAGKGLGPLRHMTADQLRTLSASGLATFGANGFYHRNLLEVSDRERREETRDARKHLEDLLEREVPYYAYPFGAADAAAVAAVRESGYKLGFTTRKAPVAPEPEDLFRLPRINWSRRTNIWKLYRPFLQPGNRLSTGSRKQ